MSGETGGLAAPPRPDLVQAPKVDAEATIGTATYEVEEEKDAGFAAHVAQEGQDHHVWVWKAAQSGVELLPVVARTATSVTVEMEDGEECVLDAAEVFPFNSSHLTDCEDAAEMNDLHEPALVGLLARRFNKDQIYTYSGDVLISINPYRDIDGLYEDSARACEGPHIFGVAKRALEGLGRGASQAILVNGESGAGKTEATKKILGYLAAHASDERMGSPATVMTGSNPAIEAFGNAVTIRNTNSSRFGKYIKVWFDESQALCGISTHQFLLEKSRLVSHGAGERNYHVFYQLVAAARQGVHGTDASELGLAAGPKAFRMLRTTCQNDQEIDAVLAAQVDDLAAFEATHASLLAIGISPEEIAQIWRTLAGLLHLGNIAFDPVAVSEGEANEDKATISGESTATLQQACKLLGLDGSEIEHVLLQRYIGGKTSVVTIPLSTAEAANSRDGLIKTIFARMFAWIVDRTHRMDHVDEQTHASIGVLDIFGFEVLARNSLEQLCVNFANEELQRLFNWHVFELERERYAAEGISWDVKTSCDNEDLLEALRGVFSLLEEQGQLGARAADRNVIAQLGDHGLVHKDRRAASARFVVQHFAAPVTYEVEGFLAKNNDALQADLGDFLVANALAGSLLAEELFQAPDVAAEQAAALEAGVARRRQARKMASTKSVSRRFRGQMTQLVDDLQQTSLHFVRCVKPNEAQRPKAWSTALVLNQLRHLGVMEAVRIRQQGYPVSLRVEEIVNRFCILAGDLSQADEGAASAREVAEIVLAQTLGSAAKGRAWQVGASGLVFMTKSSLTALQNAQHEELRRQEALEREAARIEAERIAGIKAAEEALQHAKEAESKAQAQAQAQAEAVAEARAQAEAKAQAAKAAAEAEAQAKALRNAAEEQAAREEAARQETNATRLQAWWRMVCLRRQFSRIVQARGPWQQVLRPHEAVLLSSFVVHSSERDIVRKMGLSKVAVLERLLRSKKRRGLIVTTGPRSRILLVDPTGAGLKVVAEHELDPRNTWVQLRDEKTFDITFSPKSASGSESRSSSPTVVMLSESASSSAATSSTSLSSGSSDAAEDSKRQTRATEWSFVDILGSSTPWACAMSKPQTVSALMSLNGRPTRLASTAPILWQGFLKKQAIRSKRNWRTRWFVLQQDGDEAQLLWYKAQRQTSPQGALLISRSIEVSGGGEDAPTLVVIKSPALPAEGLRLEAATAKSAQRWRARLRDAQQRSQAELAI